MIKVIYGNKLYMLIAPHGGGPTDLFSAEQTIAIAKQLKCSAVINTGWKRPQKENCDLKKGIANLNDIRQCRQKPLNDHFLKPINKLKNDIVLTYGHAFIYIIHGMDDSIRDYNGVDIIVGDGQGKPDRPTCSKSFSNNLIYCLNLWFTPARGKSGGRLSGWNNNNLNQLYVNDPKVTSVQIEMARSRRTDLQSALKSANCLADCINSNHLGMKVPVIPIEER